MPQFSRHNALDQILDIQGSYSQSSTRVLTDETAGFGAPLAGQTGSAATITTFASGVATVTDLTGMTANSVGNFLTLSGAASGGNNGTFLIISYVDATSVTISNSAGVAADANSGSIVWTERRAYSLNDDLDFERTDRAAIKGVAYSATVAPYQRPTAIGTNVPTNLSNIAGKTTDALGFLVSRKFNNVTVAATDTLVTLTSTGNLKHADAVDKTGVPCFDAAPYVGNYNSCYVEVLNQDGSQLLVQSGGHAGEKVYGITNEGSSTSPDSVEVVFYSVPLGGDVSSDSTAYTWEAELPTSVDMFYGFFQRLDQMDENSLRTISSLGVEENGNLRQDINDLQSTLGTADGALSLTGLLTNTGNYFPFVNLPDATPSVVEALNTLNAQIGNRDFTGPYLTNGQTLTSSLQALSNAVTSSTTTRYIERLASAITANTSHALPGGATYVLDGTGNGKGLLIFCRGILRDPGSVLNGDDYAETDTTHVTFFATQRINDHINYLVMG